MAEPAPCSKPPFVRKFPQGLASPHGGLCFHRLACASWIWNVGLTCAGFQVSIRIESILFLVRVGFYVSFYRTRLAVEGRKLFVGSTLLFYLCQELSRLSAGRKAWPSLIGRFRKPESRLPLESSLPLARAASFSSVMSQRFADKTQQTLGVGEMTDRIECLFCKLVDLSLDP